MDPKKSAISCIGGDLPLNLSWGGRIMDACPNEAGEGRLGSVFMVVSVSVSVSVGITVVFR